MLAELNRTVAVPIDQEADVDALVHAPPMVQVSEPNAMYEETEEMFTVPLTPTFPEVLVIEPPERTRPPRVIVLVPLANVPPEAVRVAFAVRAEASVSVPAARFRLLKAWVMVSVPVAVKATRLVPAVNVAFAAVAVQLPPTLIVAPSARSVPLMPRVTDPALIPRFAAEVSRVVFPVGVAVVLRMVSGPESVRALVAMVYATPAALVVSKVTAPPNSVAVALNVIVWLLALRNVMGARKDHDAEVVPFVQEPVTAQVPVPVLVTKPFAAIATLPFTITVAALAA